MESEYGLSESFTIKGGDFSRAGAISTKVKRILQELGIPPQIITRTAISSYEAEMNVVMYAKEATLTLNLTPEAIHIHIKDKGPGIKDISLAMKEGFSTATPKMREMGLAVGETCQEKDPRFPESQNIAHEVRSSSKLNLHIKRVFSTEDFCLEDFLDLLESHFTIVLSRAF